MKTSRIIAFTLICLLIVSCGKKAEESSFADDSYAMADSVAVDTSFVAEIATDAGVNTNQPKDRKFKKTADVEFKVKNVLQATENIENLIFSKGGYVQSSNLENNQQNYKEITLSQDSVLILRQIEVVNNMSFKVPSTELDSILRLLKQYIVFLDKRSILLEDVTSDQERNAIESERLDTYTSRQEKKIDAKGNKLNDITNAEDALLTRQLQADEARIRNKELNYNIKFSTLNIRIYQAAITQRDSEENYDYIRERLQPNLFVRIGNAFVKGWYIFEDIIVFIFHIWAIILLIIIAIITFRVMKKKKS